MAKNKAGNKNEETKENNVIISGLSSGDTTMISQIDFSNKELAKNLSDLNLAKKGKIILKSGGMAEGMISDRAKEKIEINKYYTGKAIELAKKLGAIDEKGNFIKMTKKTIDGAIIKVDNIENNVILSVHYDNYINEVDVNMTTESIFGEEVTNNNGILGSRILRGNELYELLDKVLK